MLLKKDGVHELENLQLHLIVSPRFTRPPHFAAEDRFEIQSQHWLSRNIQASFNCLLFFV